MRIDLHTHSDRSDGTDSPTELIQNSKLAGLDVVAITDHDSTQGWDEAASAADSLGIQLVPGIEVSARVGFKSVHLLGYDFDPTNVALDDELRAVIDGRNNRLPQTIAALRALGIDITVADVERWSGNAAATGRPHVADALIELGVVSNRDEAFALYLMPGRPAYVDRYAIDLKRAVQLIVDAGGRTVVAHPWSRGSDKVMTYELFAELTSMGLAGIEVDHNDHDQAARRELAGIADDLGLVKTGSSDYHGTGKINFDLGCNMTHPEQFERLLGDS